MSWVLIPTWLGDAQFTFPCDLPAGAFGGPQAQVATQSIPLAYSSVCWAQEDLPLISPAVPEGTNLSLPPSQPCFWKPSLFRNKDQENQIRCKSRGRKKWVLKNPLDNTVSLLWRLNCSQTHFGTFICLKTNIEEKLQEKLPKPCSPAPRSA